MSARTIRILAVAVVVLFAAVWLVNRQRDAGPAEDALLLPGLEERLDEVTAVTVTDADGEVRIVREADRWVIPAKDGYPADTGKLRKLLLGLAEARKVEQKTSNPELYERLGVQDPKQEDAAGVLVASEGLGDADFAVILGESAQRDYRYVRIAGEATSWLIDRNPEVPGDASGWLVAEITDIPSSRVESVTIRHEDGETIRIRKESRDAANFTVEDIPEGRELSYASVANSIASALDNLSLDDVRRALDEGNAAEGEGDAADDGEAAADAAPTRATTVFRTFDGLEVTVASSGTDDATWIRLSAAALPADGDETGTGDDPAESADAQGGENAPAGDAAAGQEGDTASAADSGSTPAAAAGDEPGSDGEGVQAGATAAAGESEETAEAEDAEAADAPDPEAEAREINARVSGWEYRIPQYKASQLRRRWEDLLRAPDTDE